MPPERVVRRIAILRTLAMREMLLAVPAFRALRAGFSEAEITLISLPYAEDVARRLGQYVDRFEPFGGYPGIRSFPYNPMRSARFVDRQRERAYDLVIQMQDGDPASNACSRALGGRMTAGYMHGLPAPCAGESDPSRMTLVASYSEGKPEVERALELVMMLGCPDLGTNLEFPIYLEDLAEARRLLSRSGPALGPIIAIHPGAAAAESRWPPEHFAAVADDLVRQTHAKVVLTGGPTEQAAAAVLERMENHAENFSGRTSLGGLAGVLSYASLVIGHATGPLYLAEAVGTPAIRICGPAEPAPFDVDRSIPARSRAGSADRLCREWPEPDEIVTLATRLLTAGAAA